MGRGVRRRQVRFRPHLQLLLVQSAPRSRSLTPARAGSYLFARRERPHLLFDERGRIRYFIRSMTLDLLTPAL